MSDATESGTTGRYRILVVDDETDILFLLKVMLESAGLEVTEAASGREAIEIATRAPQHTFDVVVLDVSMPGGLDGVDAAREIRSCKACAETRIVFHTAQPEEYVRARFSGYDGFLDKPTEGDRLVHCVKQQAQNARRRLTLSRAP